MVYKKLIRLYENRKNKLESVLKDNPAELGPERMQNIQGAIDEIELLLLTLQQYQEKAIRMNMERQLVSEPSKGSVFSRLGRIFKGSRIDEQQNIGRKLDLGEFPIEGV